jgi:hypothetical protein
VQLGFDPRSQSHNPPGNGIDVELVARNEMALYCDGQPLGIQGHALLSYRASFHQPAQHGMCKRVANGRAPDVDRIAGWVCEIYHHAEHIVLSTGDGDLEAEAREWEHSLA